MSERQKMLGGEMYDAGDPELVARRDRARGLWMRINAFGPESRAERRLLLTELLGELGDGAVVESPFFCDYGSQIRLGRNAYINLHCTILDCAAVAIGEQTFLGPNVQLLTADHPRDAATRVAGPEFARPIVIGARAWLGGGVIVCPGVSIGNETIIGAGSVVTRDIPAGVVAAGNPCRVIRTLDPGGSSRLDA